jgi:hypothetical protein
MWDMVFHVQCAEGIVVLHVGCAVEMVLHVGYGTACGMCCRDGTTCGICCRDGTACGIWYSMYDVQKG